MRAANNHLRRMVSGWDGTAFLGEQAALNGSVAFMNWGTTCKGIEASY